MPENYDEYAAVVVGAGAAGITVVGNLLEQKLEPILWVDDSFDGGRVNTFYREVLSNTQVWLLITYAESLSVFRKILRGIPAEDIWEDRSDGDDSSKAGGEDRLANMRNLDKNGYCELGYAADMLLVFSEELRKFPSVTSQEGWVTDAELNENAKRPMERWTVRFKKDGSSQTVQTQRLILCQGAHPIDDPLPVHVPNIGPIDLDVALSRTRLTEILKNTGPATVGVIGASHSAIIVLMNLYRIASQENPDLRVRWFSRHPLRYAVYMDGWILRDTTGLKGEPAKFAHENLEPETLPLSDVGNYITKVGYNIGEDAPTFAEKLPGCKFYIQAIGYRNNPIPNLTTISGEKIVPHFNHERGSFHYVKEGEWESEEDRKIPGLYGSGIAWPNRVQDPYGNIELAVGFLKFMKFVKTRMSNWN